MYFSRPFLAMAALAVVPTLSGAQSTPVDPSMTIRQGGAVLAVGSPRQTHALRLGDLYREASAANPRITAARSLARAAQARIPSATRPPDPELQLGFMNYSLPSLSQMDPMGMVQLSLMQMVPLRGKLALAGDVVEARARAEESRIGDVVWSVRARVAGAYYDLYEADQSLMLARETFMLLEGIRTTAETRYSVGEGPQADVLRAQVEIARMVEDTIRISTMRSAAAARLALELNSHEAREAGTPGLPVFPALIPGLDSLIALAEQWRPAIEAGNNEIRAAEAAVRLAHRKLWPDLAVGFQYGQRGGAMGVERMGTLMIGASVPVFAGSRQYRMREEAAAMKEMAIAELEATRSETRSAITEAYATLVRTRSLAALLRSTILPQAEASVSSALAAYRTGSVDLMTLLESRMLVNDFRRELITLDVEEGKAWAGLEVLVGRELIDPDVIRENAASGSREESK